MFRRKKIKIRVSKLLMHIAMTDATAEAVRHELTRQTREQVKGTWLENTRITVDYGFAEQDSAQEPAEVAARLKKWPPIPDSRDLTFVWVD
jgi:hypothetical protein